MNKGRFRRVVSEMILAILCDSRDTCNIDENPFSDCVAFLKSGRKA
jgi:hypothetical protein